MRIKNTFITFAGSVATKRKVEKNVKVKGFVRKGRFVRSFQRKQDVNDKTELAKKVAIGSLTVLGGVLGVSLTIAASAKLRYNRNLIQAGKDIKSGKIKTEMWKEVDANGISLPKAAYKPPMVTDKDTMTFFAGPWGKQMDKQGRGLMTTVTRQLPKDVRGKHEFIPLYNTHQVITDNTSIRDVFMRAVKDGKNQDSIDMAKEIFQWHKLNPTKPINIITHSAGGFQGRDIPHILKSAGVDTKLIKVFSTGSPDYGMVDDIVNTRRVMHVDDMYANTTPSLHRNTIFSRGALTNDFRKMIEDSHYANPKTATTDINWELAAHGNDSYYNPRSGAYKRTTETLIDFMFKSKG